MPVNSSHAYAQGRMYQEAAFRWPYLFFGRVLRVFDRVHAQVAWEQFRKNSVMGKGCSLGPNAWCVNFGKKEDVQIEDSVFCRGILRCGARGKGRIFIGHDVYIGDDTIISAEELVQVGAHTLISHGVQIFDSTGHPTDPDLRVEDWKIVMGKSEGRRPEVSAKPVIIGERVWIGFHAVIMRGVTIGNNAIVASGAVVVDDVAPDTIVAGNPGRPVKWIDRGGSGLEKRT